MAAAAGKAAPAAGKAVPKAPSGRPTGPRRPLASREGTSRTGSRGDLASPTGAAGASEAASAAEAPSAAPVKEEAPAPKAASQSDRRTSAAPAKTKGAGGTARAKGAAAPSGAPSRGRGPQAGLTDELRGEVQAAQRSLFKFADENGNEDIQFTEFVHLHRALLRLAADEMKDSELKIGSDEDIEKQFRAHDEDHNMCLDFQEWVKYMDGMLAILGPRAFLQVTGALIQEITEKREQSKDNYDTVASDRLLDKARHATNLSGKAQGVIECDQLLAKRADPSFTDRDGNHALLYAAEKADAAFVSKLLDAGAPRMAYNKDLECPALCAGRARNLEVLRLLVLPDSSPDTGHHGNEEEWKATQELVQGMSRNEGATVKELLAKRADVNYKDKDGWTALSAAVFWGKKDAAEAILRSSSASHSRLRIDTQNTRGRSALHIAARKGRVELIPLLLSHKADVDLLDADGWAPLHHATFNGLDECVVELVNKGASLVQTTDNGFTPYMLSTLPSCAGTLTESTIDVIQPAAAVNFTKKLIPILNSSNPVYQKLEDLLSLPTVGYCTKNLRLYEQFFSGRTGPNKVRLQKVWQNIACDLLRRLRSGETDIEPGGPHLTNERNRELEEERRRRLRDQQNFIMQWFEDTQGPPPSVDWTHDSREAYREELDTVVKEEVGAFKAKLQEAYGKLEDEEGGDDLCAIDALEVIDPVYLTQTGAHPILTWLDSMDVAECFEAMRRLHIAGMGKDDDEALYIFMDLMCTNYDFDSGKGFWDNIYRMWLQHYAQAGQLDFQAKVRTVVNSFNSKHSSEPGMAAIYTGVAPKSYQRMKLKEADLPPPRNEAETRFRSAAFLDVVRAQVAVDSPQAAAVLLNDFFRPMTVRENSMKLVRVVNGFHKDAKVQHGYRDVVLNVFFNGGTRAALCGRPHVSNTIGIVGEVQIVLNSFLAEKQRMYLLSKYLAGDFDHRTDPALEAPQGTSAPGGRPEGARRKPGADDEMP